MRCLCSALILLYICWLFLILVRRCAADIKVDFCGYKTGPTAGPLVSIDPKPQYEAWQKLGDALNATGRPIFFSMCPHAPATEPMAWDPPPPQGRAAVMYAPPPQWSKAQRHALGGSNGNSLMVEYGNTIDGWDGCDTCGNSSVLKHVGLIHGIDAGIVATKMFDGTSGSFNDMDMLQLCNFGEGKTGKRMKGMTLSEYRVEYSVWSIMASNLILGADVRTIAERHPACLKLALNADIIAVNQDEAAIPPRLVYSVPPMAANLRSEKITQQVFARGLSRNRTALLLLNRGGTVTRITATWKQLGLVAGSSYTVRDVIAQKDTGATAKGEYGATVPSHDVSFVILAPGAGVTLKQRQPRAASSSLVAAGPGEAEPLLPGLRGAWERGISPIGQGELGSVRGDPEDRTCPGECRKPPAGRTCAGSVPAKYADDPVCSKMLCTESVPADLSPPPILFGTAAAAGKKVAQTTPGLGYNTSRVFHSLYLPPDWVSNSSASYPIIVEYSGNTILPSEQNWTNHGWGIGQGQVFIWVVLPFISGRSPTLSAAANAAAACNQRCYHGCAPEACDLFPYDGPMHLLCQKPYPHFDPEPTIDYAIATVNYLVQRYSGDPDKVLITGHSRGSLSTMFIGLHNDRIAKLWTAFAPIAHFDGAHVTSYGKKPWQIFPPYPNGSAKDATVRLKRVGPRPVFVAGECEDSTVQAMTLLNSTGIDLANFTVLGLGFIDHNGKWPLRPDPMGTRAKLRVWVGKVLGVTMPPVPPAFNGEIRSPQKSDDHGDDVDRSLPPTWT